MPSMETTDTDVPLALRRSKRRSSVLSSPVKPRVASESNITAKTPGSRRSKRVRFSDPGLFSPSNAMSTSLTPAFRRSTLATPKQRRPATPARPAIEGTIQFTPFTQLLDERCQRRIRRNGLSEELNNYESDKKSRTALQKEIETKDAELKKLRAELDAAKVQAESEDRDRSMPTPSSQQQVDEVEAELEALRQSFHDADDDDNTTQILTWDDVPRTQGPTSEGGDTVLIHEDDEMNDFPSSHRQPSRNIQATGSDALTMGLELEAARQAKSNLLGSFRDQAVNTSFEFEFADTPVRQQQQAISDPTATFMIPETPPMFHYDISKRLREATNRAEEAEVALTALDVEITNLGFGNTENDDTITMVAAIADHFRSARLELERIIPGETTSGFENPTVLPEILSKTRLLAERLKNKEKELKASKDQHHNLKNNFEKAIIAAEKATNRMKQLETTIDNHSEETLHIRMRSQELEREVAEKEKDVAALSQALNKYRADVDRLENLISDLQQDYDSSQTQSDTKITDLETQITSETTARRTAEVNTIQRLAKINELETSLSASRRHAADLEDRLSTLQSTQPLSSATLTPILSLSSSTSARHVEEVANLQSRITSLATALASANAEVEKLKITKTKLEDRVRHEIAQGARAVEGLQEQLIRTVMKGNETRKKYVNGAKVRVANWELDDELESEGSNEPRTPASDGSGSVVRFAEWAEVETIEPLDDPAQSIEEPRQEQDDLPAAEESGSESLPGSVDYTRGRGKYRKTPRLVSYDKARRSGGEISKKRRRYDSGIGMGSSDSDFEIYEDEALEGDLNAKGRGEVRNGMMTPELSSEGDLEMVDGAVVGEIAV